MPGWGYAGKTGNMNMPRINQLRYIHKGIIIGTGLFAMAAFWRGAPSWLFLFFGPSMLITDLIGKILRITDPSNLIILWLVFVLEFGALGYFLDIKMIRSRLTIVGIIWLLFHLISTKLVWGSSDDPPYIRQCTQRQK